ncbi:MAG: hypothetical protein PHR36_03855 [Patescibacteria group bacterium]|nr:hypothetical protein [Patescibacteria group bacterium]
MLEKFIHFIRYNNVVILIIALVLILGTSALASETGQTAIGQKQTTIEGTDNTLILAADLDKFNMDFKIEKIEEDEKMYYISYTYLDLAIKDNVWQYQLKENTRRVSKKLETDLGVYLAGELKEEYEARIKELKEAQSQARQAGEQKRTIVTEYDGLIGVGLDLAAKVFPGYEPIKKETLEFPVAAERLRQSPNGEAAPFSPNVDNLTQVYQDYIEENDPDNDNVFGDSDNCPAVSNPEQVDSDGDGLGDLCEIEEPVIGGTEEIVPAPPAPLAEPDEGQSVEVIELPAVEGGESSEPVSEPVVE